MHTTLKWSRILEGSRLLKLIISQATEYHLSYQYCGNTWGRPILLETILKTNVLASASGHCSAWPWSFGVGLEFNVLWSRNSVKIILYRQRTGTLSLRVLNRLFPTSQRLWDHIFEPPLKSKTHSGVWYIYDSPSLTSGNVEIENSADKVWFEVYENSVCIFIRDNWPTFQRFLCAWEKRFWLRAYTNRV